MSASARTDVSLMEKMNDAMIFRDSAFENCEKRNYFLAYKEYAKALDCLTGEDADQDPSVKELRTDIKNQMEPIGKLRILDVPLNFMKNVSQAYCPFCSCTYGRAHEHFCAFCTVGKTVLDLFLWEQAKLQREVDLADLVKVKSRELQVLLDKGTELREQMHLLDEEVTCTITERSIELQEQIQLLHEEVRCTIRERREAQDELEESRGW